MKNNGYFYYLIGEHLQIIDNQTSPKLETQEEEEEERQKQDVNVNLSHEQLENRRRISLAYNTPSMSDKQIAEHIEENQFSMLSAHRDSMKSELNLTSFHNFFKLVQFSLFS